MAISGFLQFNAKVGLLVVSFLIYLSFVGCGNQTDVGTWHKKFHWNADEYFSETSVISLCKAIESNNLTEMQRLINAGVDLNSKGKDGMTLLLWAFPDNQIDRFKLLLANGADPNVEFERDFNTRGAIQIGDSITIMSAKTAFPGYLAAVVRNGGNPNLVHRRFQETPLHAAIRSLASPDEKKSRVELLIEAGADLEHVSIGMTPLMSAVGRYSQYDLAITLLKAGAEPKNHVENHLGRAIHILARAKPPYDNSYNRLVDIFKNHGESIDDARVDLERWDSWNMMDPQKAKRLRERELAERLKRERTKSE